MVVVEGYCIKCKAKRTMIEPKKVLLRCGKHAVRGTCPQCGHVMVRYLCDT